MYLDEICCAEIVMENRSFVVLFFCFFDYAVTFPPLFRVSEPGTSSHYNITMNAVFRATSKYMDESGLHNMTVGTVFHHVSTYFGTGKELHIMKYLYSNLK